MARQSAVQAVLIGWQRGLGSLERRQALYALLKTTMLIGALWEYVWLWHTKFYSRHYADVPISMAWSLLTVIGGITFAQIGCSAVLKARSHRLRMLDADLSRRLTGMIADYIANGDYQDELVRYANHSTKVFEECITSALLGTRGIAHERLCELPAMAILRDRWIDSLHRRNPVDRRYAVEHLALLRDPQATMALEHAVEDESDGIVAAAIRGLLRMPAYPEREKLLNSLPGRPFLVRVLTSGETPEEARELEAIPGMFLALTDVRATLTLRQKELEWRALVVEDSIKARRGGDTRAECSVLAASGAKGRKTLHFMAAAGSGGDSPAEALSGLLAAAARGGRT